MKFDTDEKTFYSYASYIQQERGYKSNWAFVMHKVNFDKWVDKKLRAETDPTPPNQDFLNWLDEYQEKCTSAVRYQILAPIGGV